MVSQQWLQLSVRVEACTTGIVHLWHHGLTELWMNCPTSVACSNIEAVLNLEQQHTEIWLMDTGLIRQSTCRTGRSLYMESLLKDSRAFHRSHSGRREVMAST